MPERGVASPNHRLRRAREQQGWSQEQLAELLGTNPFTVSRWERGHTYPGLYYRHKLSVLLQQTPEALGLLPPESHKPDHSSSSPSLLQSSMPEGGETLPAQPPPSALGAGLIGRTDLLAVIKARLEVGSNQTSIALGGVPGVGKTALAAELVHTPDIQALFPDGIYWASLGPSPALRAVLSSWGIALGLTAGELGQLPTVAALSQALRATIGLRRLLLVIDDAWHLDDALACKVGGPHCTHLLTTRSPELAVQFAHTGAFIVTELSEIDGLALLARLTPDVVNTELEQARILVRAVGGLPLALTILGHYLQQQAFSGQPRRVRAALAQLRQTEERLRLAEPYAPVELPPGLPVGTPRSLEAVIALSEHALSSQARMLLLAMSAFPPKPNTFTEEAALTIGQATIAQLDELVTTGLLESSGSGRYSLHQTIADYAQLQSQRTRQLRQPQERLAGYYAAYAESHQRNYSNLDRELVNILAALDIAWNLELDYALIQGATAIAPFLAARGLYDIALFHLGRAENMARARKNAPGLGKCLVHLGWRAAERGEYQQARTYAEESLNLLKQHEHPQLSSELWMLVGVLAINQGDYQRAEVYLREGLALAAAAGASESIGELLDNLGLLFINQGDYQRAESYLQESLTLARRVGPPERVGVLLLHSSELALRRNEYQQAESCLQEGLSIACEINHFWLQSALLIAWGETQLQQHHCEEAQAALHEAAVIARRLGCQELIAKALYGLARIAALQGNWEAAQQQASESLQRFETMGYYQAKEVRSWLTAQFS